MKENKMRIRLFITAAYFSELNPEASALFMECETGSMYFAELPAFIEKNEYLGDSVIACCETLLIMANPKYDIDENTELDCELLKLSKEEKTFNLLVNMKYPSSEQIFHDILLFEERRVEEFLYEFELLGDQRLFAAD